MARPKIAVVGSGAAAFGVLNALFDADSEFDITLFDCAQPIASPNAHHDAPGGMPRDEVVAYYDSVYAAIRERLPRKFPPPKTHFGEQIPRQPVGEELQIFKSQSLGGLTNYWGATMLAYTDREMERWPFGKETLYLGYERMSQLAGLAAAEDGLANYFPKSFATRPPIKATAVLDRLSDVVNQFGGSGSEGNALSTSSWRFMSGVNRCAVETRSDHANSCTYCGECMNGCYRDAIFSSRPPIAADIESGRVSSFVKGRVTDVDLKTRTISFESDGSVLSASGFDRIFLCAGCPATTEIVMRSFDIGGGPVMHDNSVHVFPIIYFGGRPKGTPRQEDYLSLCNLIFGCLPPDAANERFAQVQVYPNFDYLWRYNVPTKLWPLVRPFMPTLRHRIFWGRLYLHSDHSQSYVCRIVKDRFELHENTRPESGPLVREIMRGIRRAVGHRGFWIPPVKPIRQKTNSHYVATLPYGGPIIDIPPSGEIAKGVHVCDSTVFPESPAVSLTFTIMANAYRTAADAIL